MTSCGTGKKVLTVRDDDHFGTRYWRFPAAPSSELHQLRPDQMDEAAYRSVAENLPSLCWLANADGYIIWYNRRWHEYCGSTPDEMEGEGWQKAHDPEVLPHVSARWQLAIEQGEPFEMVFPLRGADGAFRPFLTRIIPLRDDAGRVQRWIGNNVDISDQRRAEEDLRRAEADLRELNRTLEQQVEERTRRQLEIEDQLRQSQKLEAVGQLTGGVAHDFNNLLTVIRGSVDLLKRPDLSETKRAQYIESIGTTADRAAKLTGQLLAFARRQALSPSMFDAGESLREICDMVATLIGSRIVVEVRIPEQRCYIIADRPQFENAIVNMCLNARDAMDGEGRLTIAAQPVDAIPAIRSHPRLPGDFMAVAITDTGCGIPLNAQSDIFEPFFTTKGVGQGTGLGLSQVIGFAKQSGGDISVASRPGEGATFTLYLPRADAAAAAAMIADRDETWAEGGGACVLIVEDNEQVGAFAAQALSELGYQSVLATDAKQALTLLKGERRFHIVFSDVVMPGMSGVDFAEQLRAIYPELPVILTSGYSHVLAQQGAHDFELLHKPYSIEQLSRALRRAVGQVRNLAG